MDRQSKQKEKDKEGKEEGEKVVEARIDVSPSCPAVTGACALTSSRTSPTLLIRSSPCHSPLAIVTPRASHPLPAPRRVSHASPHPRQHWPPPLPPPSVNQPPLFSSVRQISPGRRPSPWVGPSANFSDFVGRISSPKI